MAKTYGTEVRGVDLSTNMITLALENQAKQEEEVKKKVCLLVPYFAVEFCGESNLSVGWITGLF